MTKITSVGGLFANMSRELSFLRDNILMNDSVLQNSHDFQVRVLLYTLCCISTNWGGQESDIVLVNMHFPR
jgi:hypothetical protein